MFMEDAGESASCNNDDQTSYYSVCLQSQIGL